LSLKSIAVTISIASKKILTNSMLSNFSHATHYSVFILGDTA